MTIDPNWATVLDRVDINAFTWECRAGIMMEFNHTHCYYLNIFNEAALTGSRQSIKIINSATMMAQVKQYALDLKNEREPIGISKHTTNYPYVCEQVFPIVSKSGWNALPLDTQAKLIKFEFLRLKQEHILQTQREKQVREMLEREFEAMIAGSKQCPAPMNTAGGKGPLPKGSPPLFAANPANLPPSNNLLKRGEEWKNVDFIDDSPKGGPHLYVILSGFYNAELIVHLVKNGIPLVALIQMRRDGEGLDTKIEIPTGKSLASKSTKSKSEVPSEMNEETLKCLNLIVDFWVDYAKLAKDVNQCRYFEKIAFITYKTPLIIMNAEFPEDREANKEFMYRVMSYAMYDVQDICRQHINYVRHMEAMNVEEHRPIVTLDSMKVYNGMMDLIPLECVTIPVLLHCLLEEVDVYSGTALPDKNIVETQSVAPMAPPRKPRRCGGYKAKFQRMFERIERKYKGALYKSKIPTDIYVMSNPRIIQYGNDITLMTFHLDDPKINLEVITFEVLTNHIIPRLWIDIPLQTDQENVVYTGHLSKLFKENAVENVSLEVMWYILHLKVFEKMTCTSPMGKCILLPLRTKMRRLSSLAVAGDVHRRRNSSIGKNYNLAPAGKDSGLSSARSSVYLGDVIRSTDLAKLFAKVNEEETSTCGATNAFSMSGFNTLEPLDAVVMVQQLFNASNTFTCTDYHYFPLTDLLMLHFHNSHPENSVVHDQWEAKLPTPVCLRDFVNYVLDEESDWIAAEEDKYEEHCRQEDEEEKRKAIIAKANEALLKSALPVGVDGAGELAPVTSEDFILPGSIKERLRAAEGEEKVTVPPLAGPLPSKEEKKLPEKKITDEDQLLEMELFPPFSMASAYRRLSLHPIYGHGNGHFVGYNLGSARVQISGKTTHVYSEDGTSIKIEKSEWNYGNKLLSLEIKKGDHSLYLHSMATDPPTAEDPFTFHVMARNGIILGFSKTPIAACREIRKKFDNLIVRRTTSGGARIVWDSAYYPRETSQSLVEQKDVTKPIVTGKSSGGPAGAAVTSKSNPPEKKPIEKVFLEPAEEIESKMDARQAMERQLNEYLMSDEVLDPDYAKKCQFTRSKAQVLTALGNAKQNYFPCYKIYSSKLHLYKYIKRIKPHITVSIGGVVRRINYKAPSLAAGNVDTKLHYKWTKISSTIIEDRIPMNFEFHATWPSGLSIMTVPSVYLYDPFYIKQTYSSKGPACKAIADENCRCFLRNGTLLIFRKEGKLKILCSDSSTYNCQIDGFRPLNLKPNIEKMRHERRVKQQKAVDTTTVCYDTKFKQIMRTRRITNHIIEAQTGLKAPLSRRIYIRRQKKSYKVARDQYTVHPSLLPIPEYTVLLADGTKTSVRNGKVCSFPSKLMVQAASDYVYGETYMEREDGSHCLLCSDGTLTTCFPDGSRISTSFVVEPNEVFVEFTEGEYLDLQLLLAQEQCDVSMDDVDLIGEHYAEEECPLVFEGFVSVVLNCSFEHPNYARVSYYGLDASARIKMPDDIDVRVDRNGSYEAQLDPITHLKITEENITFHSIICGDCSTVSKAEIDISPFTVKAEDLPPYYLVNTDSVGQTVHVEYNGCVRYSQGSDDSNEDATPSHQCLSFSSKDIRRPKQRFFVLDRDFSGAEFIHDEDKAGHIAMVMSKKHSTLCGEKNNAALKDNYLTIMHGITKNHSERWLAQYSVPKVIPMYIKRKDMLPSTYYPGFWLSAFPRPRSMQERRKPSVDMTELREIPKVLVQRVFMDISVGDKFHDKRYEPLLQPVVKDPRAPLTGTSRSHLVVSQPCTNSSASNFKKQWYKRGVEMEYYKDVIRKNEVPPYFSKEMENIMFGQPSIPSSYSTVSKAPSVAVAEQAKTPKSPTNLVRTKQLGISSRVPYSPNLVYIAREWVKRGYHRYQPVSKGRNSNCTQTDVTVLPEAALKHEPSVKGGDITQLATFTSVSRPTGRTNIVAMHMEGPKQQSLVAFEDIVSPRCLMKLPRSATGSRPYVRPMGHWEFLSTRSEVEIDATAVERIKSECSLGVVKEIFKPPPVHRERTNRTLSCDPIVDGRRFSRVESVEKLFGKAVAIVDNVDAEGNPLMENRGVQTQKGVDENIETEVHDDEMSLRYRSDKSTFSMM